MKDETKEINITFPGQILDYVDTKDHLLELFNYITNLQEENEYLKKNQRFHKKFGSDYIFCLEADKETYKDMVLEKQEEVEQLQKRIDSLKDQVEWCKQQCDDLEMQVSNNE